MPYGHPSFLVSVVSFTSSGEMNSPCGNWTQSVQFDARLRAAARRRL